MKTTVTRPIEIEVTHIHLNLPVRFDEEDIPNDFPLRSCDTWQAMVNIDTARVHNWPTGIAGKIKYMKVCDEGIYTLYADGTIIAQLEGEYVPHGVVPGEYGDYVTLLIDETGIITNWPKSPDVSAFFKNGKLPLTIEYTIAVMGDERLILRGSKEACEAAGKAFEDAKWKEQCIAASMQLASLSSQTPRTPGAPPASE